MFLIAITGATSGSVNLVVTHPWLSRIFVISGPSRTGGSYVLYGHKVRPQQHLDIIGNEQPKDTPNLVTRTPHHA